MILNIATVQHSVGSDVEANFVSIVKYIRQAKHEKADIVHFPECNLSGYAGIDFDDIATVDVDLLDRSFKKIRTLVKEIDIHVIIGSHHFVSDQERPFNSLFLINNKGEIQARYDKRHLTQAPEFDHLYYHPGSQSIMFDVKGVKCGLLICHEWRYPEFYREYLKQGVRLIFQSFYDGSLTTEQYLKEGKELGDLITGGMRGNAANNYMWISVSNTSRKESCYPSLVLRPDGSVSGRLARNRSGMMITKIDFEKKYADPSRKWRGR